MQLLLKAESLFKSVSQPSAVATSAPMPSPQAQPAKGQPRRRRVRQIQHDDHDDDRYAAVSPAVDDATQQGDDDLVFSVDDHKPKQPTATVKVNGTFVRFIVDTGASVNIMEENVFAKLNPKPPLQRAPSSIYAYGSNTPMITLGAFHAEVESKNKLSEALIYVVGGKHGSLLSYHTAVQLDLIRLNVNALRPIAPHAAIENLAVSHPQLFNGTGKLKSHQIRLHIDQSVKPCIQPQASSLSPSEEGRRRTKFFAVSRHY